MLHHKRIPDAFVVLEAVRQRTGGFEIANLANQQRKVARDALRVSLLYQCSQLNKAIMDMQIDEPSLLHPALTIYRAA